jgi:phospholipid/cholesterol/gamma-HCH transport system permease protein
VWLAKETEAHVEATGAGPLEWVRKLGRGAPAFVRAAGRMGIFLFRALVCLLSPPWKVMRLVKQMRFIGAESVLVVVLTGGFTGMVLGFQGYYTLSRVGSEAFLGPMVALALVKELGPVLASLMVMGRAGSAVTAELGIMRLGEQVDALEMMGLSPQRYLVVPNLLASVLCVPLLIAIFDVVGIGGGYLIGVNLLGVSPGVYLGEMISYVDMVDVYHGVWKSLSFGLIIGWVSCYKGFSARRTAEGVSKATTEAVVLASVLILSWDCFMTAVLP